MKNLAESCSLAATALVGICFAGSTMLGIFYMLVINMVIGSGHPSVVDNLGGGVYGVLFFKYFTLPIILACTFGLATYFQFRAQYVAAIAVVVVCIVVIGGIDMATLGHLPYSFSEVETIGDVVSHQLFPQIASKMN